MIPSSPFRAEVRANLRIAVPLIAAQMAGVGMGTIDTVMAGRISDAALAAVSVGSNLNVTFFVFVMGVLMACSPIVAQRAGAGRADVRVGAFVREALLLAVGLAVLWTATAHLLAAPILAHIGLAPDTAATAVQFLQAYSWSSFGFCIWFVLRYTAEGVGMTRPIFWSGVVGLCSNLLLDWIFMYGKFGFPAMGAVGCGWATTLSSLLMAAVLAVQYSWHAPLRAFQVLQRMRPRLEKDAREILRLGIPIGMILTAEAGLFVAVSLLMARFGDEAVAAYQVALNFASVMFMIPLGVGLATTVRVGHAVGAGDLPEARQRGYVGMCLGAINAASNATLMLLFPAFIAGLYTDNGQIVSVAAAYLCLAAAFQLFDGLQVTANGALRGIKDTRIPMLITVAAYWLVGMPVALWLAFRVGLGPSGLWWGLTAGLAVAALGLSLRFRSKSKRLKSYLVMS
ncbi:MAG: MATE family efflux transporter [Stenotrophobium sp.]